VFKTHSKKSPNTAMKLGKPSYDSSAKVYTCELKDGFRFESQLEDGVFTPPLEAVSDLTPALVSQLLTDTKGWFSKPLTAEWLSPRIQYDVSTGSVSDGFEGTLVWQAVRLMITKDKFMFILDIVEQKKSEILIDFQEDAPVAPAAPAAAPEPAQAQGNNVARRELHKKTVMEARAKAARALFKAERSINEYIELYGDDTDWEDECDSS